MDIGEIIGDALRYPTSDWMKVIELGILFLLSFLIVPAFLALGYSFRALKATIAGLDELPDFDEWVDMLIDGLKVFAVTIVYMIIPIIVIVVTMGLSSPAALPIGYPNMTDLAIMQPGMGIGILIAFILAILFGLLLTVAIAHMAFNDSLGAAFQIGEILNIISEIGWVDYVIWYIAVIIIGGIGFVASFIIGIIPLIGPIISFVLTAILLEPYLNLFYYRAIGLRYAYE